MSMNEMIKLGIRLSVVSRSCSFSLKVLLVVHDQIWFDFKSSFLRRPLNLYIKLNSCVKLKFIC